MQEMVISVGLGAPSPSWDHTLLRPARRGQLGVRTVDPLLRASFPECVYQRVFSVLLSGPFSSGEDGLVHRRLIPILIRCSDWFS